MVYLDPDTLVIFVFLWVLFIILFSIGLKGSRKKALKKGMRSWFTEKSPKTLTWGAVILSFLILIFFICGRVEFSTIDISKLAEDLQDCDRLVINDHFIDFDDSGKKREIHISITEPNDLDILTDIIISTPLIRVLQIHRVYYSSDYIEIEIFQDEKNIDSFVITHNKLAIYGRLGERGYLCNRNQNSTLLHQIRKTLFPDRPLSFAEKYKKSGSSLK